MSLSYYVRTFFVCKPTEGIYQASPKISYSTMPMGELLKQLQTALTHLPSNVHRQSNTTLRTGHQIPKWWRHMARVKLCLTMHRLEAEMRKVDRKMKLRLTHSSSRNKGQDSLQSLLIQN
ncbi:hypothetical protein SCLCIDRAFT_1217938 [Scleroderma citrinum Foug A]|uniref:Uncharacterized protein n=1 Tax=Scleroderma citrinum Foug A TaxID=1036808 RepID=A0A0C3DEQ0_9AGAM|nr:hypothetical protein SCLCIDRAFT_1217938 [Scleroderma citrinum Foug A]